MLQIAAGGTLLACGPARAEIKKIDENEPKALSLGYRHDTTQVDQKRFPKHAAAENCSACMAWLGKRTDAWAGCDVFADRLVASNGWCITFVKPK
jgi:hypothetical protein